MKLYHNVLPTETLNKCSIELNSLLDRPVWTVSDLFWQKEIQVGVTGVCTAALVSDELNREISQHLKDLLPEHEGLMMQHYIWHKNSAISSHDDGKHKFGGTLYLNQNWNIDYGGIFIWKDPLSGELLAKCPEYNTMMINDTKNLHMVTPISPLTIENRITIQIWGY